MDLTEKQVAIPIKPFGPETFAYFHEIIGSHLKNYELPVRFVINVTDDRYHHCEISVLSGLNSDTMKRLGSIFDFVPRQIECNTSFNVVFVVPTGIGAEIGGHAGDATPVVKALGEVCDYVITHPNVVNASDINEMTANTLYVEGSALARLLMGTVALQPIRSNRVLVVIDDHEVEMFANDTVNAVSAGRATYGLDCPKVLKLSPPLAMEAEFSVSGRAAGQINGFDRLDAVLRKSNGTFDAVAIASVIDFDEMYHEKYFRHGGSMINPWGGVEAMLTHAISILYNVPTAHSPMLENQKIADLDLGLVEPRLAAEAVSMTFIQCMLKGLHRSPRIILDPKIINTTGLVKAENISCMIIPDKCLGLPTLAALEQGITVIAVRENKNIMQNDLKRLPWKAGQLIMVENYWEALGVVTALKAGIVPASLRRPLANTEIETTSF
ncbi:MAG: DUF3326 domain-containing protein [Pseudomonadota bacterium]|nr:DUF3326 domain-containing protein [Pseudomonadota bacterium]